MAAPDTLTNGRGRTNALLPPLALLTPLNYSNSAGDSDTPNVATPCLAYQEMWCRWNLISDLLGGTLIMRAACHKWLPQEPLEKDETYQLRLSRSFLYPGLENNIDKLSARPFLQPIKLTGNALPTPLDKIAENADRTGNTLTLFNKQVFEDGVAYGMSHILVDYPSINPTASHGERQEKKIRPTFVHVPATSLIGWKYEYTDEGFERLTEIRFRTSRSEYSPENEYAEEEVPLVRKYTRNTWEIWKRVKQKTQAGETITWVKDAEGINTLGEVPLVTFYTRRVGFMRATPPLENLAWLNLAHWQSASDQRNILRFARVGILFAKGIPQEKQDEGFAVGPSTLLAVDSTDADMKYVEHNGHAIEAGRNDLKDLEAQIEVLGFQPLVQRVGGAGATGRALDEIKGQTIVENWIESLESTTVQAYQLAAKWEDKKLPENFGVDIYADFGLTPRTRDDILALLEMAGIGKIGDEDLIKELVRRDLLSNTIDIPQFIARAKKDFEEQQKAKAELEKSKLMASAGAGGDGVSARLSGRFGGTGGGSRDPKKSDNNGGKSRNRNRGKDALTANVQDTGIAGQGRR